LKTSDFSSIQGNPFLVCHGDTITENFCRTTDGKGEGLELNDVAAVDPFWIGSVPASMVEKGEGKASCEGKNKGAT